MNKITWSPTLTDILTQHYPAHGATICCAMIRRIHGINLPTWKIIAKARRMGIRYTGPIKGFKPGQTPHNKGVPMPPATYEKCRRTMFRPDNTPHNHIGDGVISVRKHKSHTGDRLYIRHQGTWMLLSHHVYAQHHGAIPPNHVIRHRDGNPHNCDISNLECVSRRDLIAANANRPAAARSMRIYHFNRLRGNLSFIDAILQAI